MSNGKYLKGSCSECGNHIEFPESGVGMLINCPHCGLKTRLGVAQTAAATPAPTARPQALPAAAPTAPAAAPTGSRGVLLGVGILALLAMAGGGVWWKMHATEAGTAGATSGSSPAGRIPTASHSNSPPAATETPGTPPAPTAPKSATDLKAGAIRFEKTKGSSLVYAVGTINNDSDYQRFGVRVELNLINARGDRVGGAQDYIAIIEPRKAWEFRVLVNDPKAVAATLSAIKEE